MHKRSAMLLLNVAHAVDHMFLLIFATAVASIAAEFGFARWEDLMPFGVGAFVMFGLGSLPSGRLGDLWGRRSSPPWRAPRVAGNGRGSSRAPVPPPGCC